LSLPGRLSARSEGAADGASEPANWLEFAERFDQQFEVDDAVCADDRKYDLKFDMQMQLKRKNLD
jgi:hypothetical protein